MITLKHGNATDLMFSMLQTREAAGLLPGGATGPSMFFDRLMDAESDQPDKDKLEALANSMNEASDDAEGAADIPAGVTFLGQFIDHDLTLDMLSALGEASEGELPNFRTPRLDLDSVYRDGPGLFPFAYDRNFHFVVGTDGNSGDLPRNSAGIALIGDPRNDENMFVSQLHGLFLRFHNYLLDQETGGGEASEEQFERVCATVRALYQSIVVTEYLPAIVADSVLTPMVEAFWKGALPGPVDWANAPDMPFEFSAAAFRFGHSQVRSSYRVNGSKTAGLFDVGGFKPVDSDANVAWNLFFDFGDGRYQKARTIDSNVAKALFMLPPRIAGNDGPSLPFRNLVRGQHTFGLPYGEDVAAAWGMPSKTHDKVEKAGLVKSPLWFYVLAEAEDHGGKLGPVGGTIVAGTILNLLLRDSESIAHTGGPDSAGRMNALAGASTTGKPA